MTSTTTIEEAFESEHETAERKMDEREEGKSKQTMSESSDTLRIRTKSHQRDASVLTARGTRPSAL